MKIGYDNQEKQYIINGEKSRSIIFKTWSLTILKNRPILTIDSSWGKRKTAIQNFRSFNVIYLSGIKFWVRNIKLTIEAIKWLIRNKE